MNLSVIQTEHLLNDPAALGCYLSVDDMLVDIITPISSQNPENNTQVPTAGKIQFVIKDMRKDEILGTFVGLIQEISSQSQSWLVLTSTLTPTPKILVSINCEHPNTQSVPISQNNTELVNKIRELSTTILELECKLGLEKEHKEKEITQKSQMLHELQVGSEITLEQFKIKLQNSFRIIQELTKQKDSLLKLCDQEQRKSEILIEKLKESQLKYDAMCESLQRNNLIYIEENSELQKEAEKLKQKLNEQAFEACLKDAKISELSAKLNILKEIEGNQLKSQVTVLTQQLEESQKQIMIYQELKDPETVQIDHCENCSKSAEKCEKLSKTIENLSLELMKYKEQSGFIQYLQEHSFYQDSEIHSLQSQLLEKDCEISKMFQSIFEKSSELSGLSAENQEIIQECTELKQRVLTLTKSIEVLEREITNLKCKNMTARRVEKIKLDEVDFQLEHYLFDQGIENLFVKLAHGVYIYGTKRVNISLKNDNRLICRTGGGYTPIDQFLKLYQNTEVEDISKYVKKQSLFLSQGSSPMRSLHKRAISTTPEINQKGSPRENQTDRNLEKKILEKLSVVYPLKERNFTPVRRKN